MNTFKVMMSAGATFAVVAGAALVTASPAISADKPAIEVITHAGAGGGTDVNSRMMMLRSRRTLLMIWRQLCVEQMIHKF